MQSKTFESDFANYHQTYDQILSQIFVLKKREEPFCLTADIQIKQSGEGISVYAASFGLHEVYFDKKSWKVKAKLITLVMSLKGKTKKTKRDGNSVKIDVWLITWSYDAD